MNSVVRITICLAILSWISFQTIASSCVKHGDQACAASWQNDLKIMSERLHRIITKAKTPEKKELLDKHRQGESILLTDGAGGWIDLNPAVDSVQSQVNRLHKNRQVAWEFALAVPPLVQPNLTGDHEIAILSPDNKASDLVDHLLWISLPQTEGLELSDLKHGTRISLQGTIGQNDQGQPSLGHFQGIYAAYYLDNEKGQSQTRFIIGFKNATLNILNR